MFNSRYNATVARVGLAAGTIIAALAVSDNAHADNAHANNAHATTAATTGVKSVKYKSCIVLTAEGEKPCADPKLAASGHPIPLAIGRPTPHQPLPSSGSATPTAAPTPTSAPAPDEPTDADDTTNDPDSNSGTSITIISKDAYSSSTHGNVHVINPHVNGAEASVDGYSGDPDEDDDN